MLLAKKARDATSVVMMKKEYFQLIDDLNVACVVKQKAGRQYYIGRYEILRCCDVEKLIYKHMNLTEEPVYFVNIDDTYDIGKHANISTGQGDKVQTLTQHSRYLTGESRTHI